MRAAQLQRLIQRQLLPALPGFAVQGPLLFATPLEYHLRGFYFERSSISPASYYLWAFVQPLYVPSQHVYFTFGRRLGGDSQVWTLGEEQARGSRGNGQHPDSATEPWRRVFAAIVEEGQPFIGGAAGPDDFTGTPAQSTLAPDDPYVIEAKAYTLILADEIERSRQILTHLANTLAALSPALTWPREIAERARQIELAIARHPAEAIALLDAWTLQTARALGLPQPQLAKRSLAQAR